MEAPHERYTHERLERIELKMDRLVETVTQIARLEERQDHMASRCHACNDELTLMRQRITANEAHVSKASVYAGLAERGIGHLAAYAGAAVIGGVLAYFQFGGAP